ncbi:glycosyltransferase family 2 protein [Halonotius aquaticus]|uniref:Glycosyltransferase family 2 protein n=1 Tax=Halonotius aquaticus TaxID=2216978 RepID=A0A3A6PYR9_9EURY|nr:glycosyltransferase family 2 protein [Halonotius aquaticus]
MISFVLPTMNEAAGIEECIDRATRALEQLGVTGEIIISDDSTDETPEIARSMGAIVVKPDSSGYGYAYRYAFEAARGELIVMGDADTTYNFEELPTLLDRLTETNADIVLGSRLAGEIKDGAMPPLHKYIGNPLLTWFLNAFYDAGVSDAHSGFRVVTREALETMELESDGMEFASEMIMDAASKGLTIEEVPITYHEREGEATLESFTDGWRHVKFMLVNAPGYLFSLPGIVLGVIGVLIMGLGYTGTSIAGQPFGIHSLIAGSLLTLLSYQIGSLGLLSEISSDPIQASRDPITKWIRQHFTLERGILVGIGLVGIGSAMVSLFVWRWVQSGFVELPPLRGDIVAFTLIVVGIQTIFGSFFMSILSNG